MSGDIGELCPEIRHLRAHQKKPCRHADHAVSGASVFSASADSVWSVCAGSVFLRTGRARIGVQAVRLGFIAVPSCADYLSTPNDDWLANNRRGTHEQEEVGLDSGRGGRTRHRDLRIRVLSAALGQ
jgi:hypothetical protein